MVREVHGGEFVEGTALPLHVDWFGVFGMGTVQAAVRVMLDVSGRQLGHCVKTEAQKIRRSAIVDSCS